MTSRRVRSIAVVVASLLASALPLGGGALAADPVRPVFVEGQAQIVPEFNVSSQWIRQQVWVETEFDSDGDGELDRMHTDVTRQLQTETEGLKVPVIYMTSPYYAGTSGPQSFLWNVHHELGDTPPPRTSQPAITFNPNRTFVSNSGVTTWVPRGFAVVHSDSPGTGLSDGCPTVGGANESLAPKAVVDWLNGRTRAFTSRTGGAEVAATWSTGKVGMTGTSYDGTLPLAAATTGVEGLEAIIPVAPNTSYYHYYRANGLVRSPGGWLGEDIDFLFDFINSGDPANRPFCIETVREGLMKARQDRVTGDLNDFWTSRDYLTHLDKVTAPTLMAHAFNDWNVIPEHSVRISEALEARGVPVQEYFHQGGHGGNPPMPFINRWFTRYLYGIQNGVENDPQAWVVREAASCPPRTTTAAGEQSNTAVLTVASTSPFNRGLVVTVPQTNADATVTNTTREIIAIPDATTLVLASPVATAAGQRVVHGANVFINGCSTTNPTPYGEYPNPSSAPVTLRPQPGGNTSGGFTSLTLPVAAEETLIDDYACGTAFHATQASSTTRLLYRTPVFTAPVHISGTPTATVRLASSKARLNLTVGLVRLPWTGNSLCTSTTTGTTTSVVTRGWADARNRTSLSTEDGLVPGEFVDVTFPLQPDDQVLPAGTQLGLMILSSDREFTLRPAPGTEMTVALAGTSINLPVVGGPLAMPICPTPDTRETVFIGTTNTRVPNRTLAGTCTINDHILDDAAWDSHGAFVSHVSGVGDLLVDAGKISGREHGLLSSAAARSSIGGRD